MLAQLILLRDVVACGAGLLILTLGIVLAAHVAQESRENDQ